MFGLIAPTLAFGLLIAGATVTEPASAQTPGDIVSTLRAKPLASQRSPLRRHRYFYEQMSLPDEMHPPGALRRAIEQHELSFGPVRADPGQDAAFGKVRWRPLGPTPIGTSVPTSGRVTSIAIDPTNANNIYIGAAAGGVWKTTDGGSNWLPLTDSQCSAAVGAVSLDPLNPRIVYAGTGEENFSGDSYYGCGVLKSVDGGVTWTRLGASVFAPASAAGARIGRIAIHPTQTNTLLLATTFGLYRSTDGGVSFANVQAGTATDVVINPSNPNIMYAGLGNIFGATSNGIYKSVNAGQTWTPLGGGTSGLPSAAIGRISLAIAASSPSTVYASIHDSGTDALLGIWKTVDDGATWSQVTATGATCSNQCWYDMNIAVDPTNANIVYFSGFSIYRSTDGGVSFTNIGSAIHVDHHGFAFQPGAPTTIFAGSDGGVFKSTNSGGAWTSLNTTLAITQMYAGVSLHPTNGAVYMAGTQDNGTVVTTGALNWRQVIGGDGGFSAIDFSTPTIAYGETQWTQGSATTGPRKSTNFGSTNTFNLATSGIAVADPALFIPPLIMSPTTSSTLYFGTNAVYKTTDSAVSWTRSATTLSGNVSWIAEAPSDSTIVYASANTGDIYRSSDGGGTFTLMPRPSSRFPSSIIVQPSDPNTLFVSYTGFSGLSPSRHVYKSTNGGSTWADISGNLPDIPVNSMTIDPSAPLATIMIGTDLGVYITRNGGTTWTPFNPGLPFSPVRDLKYNAATGSLIAATHGRGAWRAVVKTRTAMRDYDADFASDVVLRLAASDVSMWQMNGSQISTTINIANVPNATWKLIASGDFDGDGKADLLWQNSSNGEVWLWFMNGGTIASSVKVATVPPSIFTPVGAGDFDGNGTTDMIWRDERNGDIWMWLMSGATISSSARVATAPSPTWTILGTGDFTGDGKADILARNNANNETRIWAMNGTTRVTDTLMGLLPPSVWSLTSLGDFDGDGVVDMMWRNIGSGEIWQWRMVGGAINTSTLVATVPFSAWTAVGTGDYDGDGKADLLWRNNSSGEVWLWVMNGATIVAGQFVSTTPLSTAFESAAN